MKTSADPASALANCGSLLSASSKLLMLFTNASALPCRYDLPFRKHSYAWLLVVTLFASLRRSASENVTLRPSAMSIDRLKVRLGKSLKIHLYSFDHSDDVASGEDTLTVTHSHSVVFTSDP